MALFGKSKPFGIMDVIRCDEPSYLIWKWHPANLPLGNNNRENAIRWGSCLRVKDGEVAVFVYNQRNGAMQDYIEGPFDQILETENLPILANIIGLAYQNGTPFQAEVYFINLAKVIQVPFAVPYFDLFDSRHSEFGVPTAVRGKITFNITDYREFIKLHRLINFDLSTFQIQIRDAMARYVKSVVTNAPAERNIPVLQIERAIEPLNDIIETTVRERFKRDFGVNITAVDINAIEIDKASEGYQLLKTVTLDLATATAQAQARVNIKNIQDMQEINVENTSETLRMQRTETQYAQRKQTQMSNFAAYQLEQQAAVGTAGAEALGHMGASGATEMTGVSGMNPAAMMAGMAMGGVIGKNISGIMNSMISDINEQQIEMQQVTPPPIPNAAYHVVQDGQAKGPYDMHTLAHMVDAGTLTRDSLVWKQGMIDWAKAGTVHELQPMFGSDISPIPPIPSKI